MEPAARQHLRSRFRAALRRPRDLRPELVADGARPARARAVGRPAHPEASRSEDGDRDRHLRDPSSGLAACSSSGSRSGSGRDEGTILEDAIVIGGSIDVALWLVPVIHGEVVCAGRAACSGSCSAVWRPASSHRRDGARTGPARRPDDRAGRPDGLVDPAGPNGDRGDGAFVLGWLLGGTRSASSPSLYLDVDRAARAPSSCRSSRMVASGMAGHVDSGNEPEIAEAELRRSLVMYEPTSVAVCCSTGPSRRSAWPSWKCANAAAEAIGFTSSSGVVSGTTRGRTSRPRAEGRCS